MRAFCSSHQVSRVGFERSGAGPRSGPWGEADVFTHQRPSCARRGMPGWSSEGPERVNFRERDSEYKDGLMSPHWQWVASPSEKAGLLLSALLIGLVNLGSRGLDTAARRTASVSGVAGPSRRSPALYDLYQRLPLTFERNAGQTDRRVKFLARGPGYTLFLTGDEAVLSLRSQESGARSQKQEGRPWSLVPSHLQKPTDSEQATKAKGPRTNDVI